MNLHQSKGLEVEGACLPASASELFIVFYTKKYLLAPATGSNHANNTKGNPSSIGFPSPFYGSSYK
jgi:hypothetical protein|tara:strand:- start:547 stop:744 length:198 start_codon:yes stop_codon:yes gene_type:complete